jgi:hypothetical protein
MTVASRATLDTWLRGGELRLIAPALGLPLFPVRPDVSADHAALGANHPRAELAHVEVSGLLVDVDDDLVPAAVAHESKRPRTVLTHVRQVHRLDVVLEPVGHGFTIRLPHPDHRRLSAPHRSGPSRDWIKVKNPDSTLRHNALQAHAAGLPEDGGAVGMSLSTVSSCRPPSNFAGRFLRSRNGRPSALRAGHFKGEACHLGR